MVFREAFDHLALVRSLPPNFFNDFFSRTDVLSHNEQYVYGLVHKTVPLDFKPLSPN